MLIEHIGRYFWRLERVPKSYRDGVYEGGRGGGDELEEGMGCMGGGRGGEREG